MPSVLSPGSFCNVEKGWQYNKWANGDSKEDTKVVSGLEVRLSRRGLPFQSGRLQWIALV